MDDEAGVRFGIRDFLESKGFAVEEAGDCNQGQRAVAKLPPDIVILDYMLPDGNALDLLPRLRSIDPDLPVIILTGHGSIDLAVKAIQQGAENFLVKPVELPALQVILDRALAARRRRRKQLAGENRESRTVVAPFLGVSHAIQTLAEEARAIVGTESPIIIQGETGAGKGVLAAWLHRNGPRSDEAFVDLNCAGLSRDFLESDLFGHERGAFTGALQAKKGLLEVADHGTVFLDEIGDMSPEVQPKLLKVLEEKKFRRLGSVTDRRVDIHLIAATHQDLKQQVGEGKFRGDLYYRINTIPLVLPSLRERVEDIPILARHMLQSLTEDIARDGIRLSDDALEALQGYAWPGNIRELRNVLERALMFNHGGDIGPESLHLDSSVAAPTDSGTADLTLREAERRHIEDVLQREGGRVGQAAERLSVPKSTLYQKIKQYGIKRPMSAR